MPKVISGLKGRDVLSNLKECVKTSINSAKEIDINNLSNFKFKKAIRWPYPENGDCNFIEFINQLFTTVASIKAIEYLKAEEDDWVMNLGTTPGRDLTVKKDSENIIIIAEIFAVTDPQSNNKLKDEIISLATLLMNTISVPLDACFSPPYLAFIAKDFSLWQVYPTSSCPIIKYFALGSSSINFFKFSRKTLYIKRPSSVSSNAVAKQSCNLFSAYHSGCSSQYFSGGNILNVL